MSSVVVHAAALLAYLAAAVFYGANLSLRASTHLGKARALFLLGVFLHTTAIGLFCLQARQSPFASSYGTLSVAAWAVALLYLPVELLGRVPALGALSAPISGLLLFGAILRSRAVPAAEPEIRSRIISLHVLLVLFSFALFALAACCAVFYVWQYGLLKRPDRRALFRRLPPLETVDSMAYHLVAFALPLLTLGLALGILRAVGGALSGNWLADPHFILSVVVWLVYGVYLFARLVAGWRGTRLNYLLIAGLAVTLLLYIVPSTTHRFS